MGLLQAVPIVRLCVLVSILTVKFVVPGLHSGGLGFDCSASLYPPNFVAPIARPQLRRGIPLAQVNVPSSNHPCLQQVESPPAVVCYIDKVLQI